MSKRIFDVYLIGIISAEKRMLVRSFLLSESRRLVYQLTDETLTTETKGGLVIIDEPLERIPKLNMPIVILNHDNLKLSDESRSFGVYTLNRPLLATRVLRLLDKVVEQEYHYSPKLQVGNYDPSIQRLYANRKKSSDKEKEAQQKSKKTFAHVNALVIDDSSMIRKQMELVLGLLGVECDFAENGEEGIEKQEGGYYDIIFLDIMMPGIDGFQTCKQLRKLDSPAKIIMLTSKSSRLHKARGSFAGVDEYLVKPASYEDLFSVLSRYFGQSS